jgi:hypothetical protein
MIIVSNSSENVMCSVHGNEKALTTVEGPEADDCFHMCAACESEGYDRMCELFQAWRSHHSYRELKNKL